MIVISVLILLVFFLSNYFAVPIHYLFFDSRLLFCRLCLSFTFALIFYTRNKFFPCVINSNAYAYNIIRPKQVIEFFYLSTNSAICCIDYCFHFKIFLCYLLETYFSTKFTMVSNSCYEYMIDKIGN